MKNIESILTECGITLTEEQATAVNKAVNENYKTIAEFEKKDAKIETLTAKVKETEEALKTFEGIDAEGMRKTIADLTQSLADKDKDYTDRMAERDFQDILNASIAEVKGLNAKAIKSLLDVDALRASQNQKEDIANALKGLTEAEDSKMLFAQDAPLDSPIGSFSKKTQSPNYLDDKYGKSRYYHKN